jgi:hypothetical protein
LHKLQADFPIKNQEISAEIGVAATLLRKFPFSA